MEKKFICAADHFNGDEYFEAIDKINHAVHTLEEINCLLSLEEKYGSTDVFETESPFVGAARSIIEKVIEDSLLPASNTLAGA